MRNWAGSLEYSARHVLHPRSIEELQEVVAASSRVKALGTRHSFSAVGDTTGDLVSLDAMPPVFAIDPDAATVTVDGAATYASIGPPLEAAGFALDNLPSLPHITVAGACATGTHGSGDRLPILSAAIAGMELITADGSLRRLPAESEVPLAAAAVSLGSLGVAATLTLRVRPAVPVRQDVYVDVPAARFEEVLALATGIADSASLFTTWRTPTLDQVWLKRRLSRARDDTPAGADADPDAPLPDDLAGGVPAQRNLHPIPGFPPEACTPQLGVPGPWYERLPHFRASHTPSSGDELQSEYFVARDAAGPAFRTLLAIRRDLAPVVQVSEIRTIPADDLWLSPAQGRDTVAFHFTWVADAGRVAPMVKAVERALAPFEPRAHWAKLATMPPRTRTARYPRFAEFVRLAARLDPEGKLRNKWLDELFEAA